MALETTLRHRHSPSFTTNGIAVPERHVRPPTSMLVAIAILVVAMAALMAAAR